MVKLKAVKPLLKNWNVASFGNIAIQKAKDLNLLNHWDKGGDNQIAHEPRIGRKEFSA